MKKLSLIKIKIDEFHELLEHLKTHSNICSELIEDIVLKETIEMFEHIDYIDSQTHYLIEHTQSLYKYNFFDVDIQSIKNQVSIDEIKNSIKHIFNDVNYIHNEIMHILNHIQTCNDMAKTKSIKEFDEIKEHIEKLDIFIHDIIVLVNELKNFISSEYSEFIWEVPEKYEKYLSKTSKLDIENEQLKKVAFSIADECENSIEAIIQIYTFVSSQIFPKKNNIEFPKASEVLESKFGDNIARATLICALSRVLGIPSRIDFFIVSLESLNGIYGENFDNPNNVLHAVPEMFVEGKWKKINDIYEEFLVTIDINKFKNKFILNCENNLFQDEKRIQKKEYINIDIPLPKNWYRVNLGIYNNFKDILNSSNIVLKYHEKQIFLFGNRYIDIQKKI